MYELDLESIVNYYKIDLDEVLKRWNEPHRYFHTKEHLDSILSKINKYKSNLINNNVYISYILAALFHDVVYVPGEEDNEEKSVLFMKNMIEKRDRHVEKAIEIILETRFIYPINHYLFWKFDNQVLLESDFHELLSYEKKIKAEFSNFDQISYKKGRIDFLKEFIDKNDLTKKNESLLEDLMDFIKYN